MSDELRCCLQCGRDTKNKSQICKVCTKGIAKHNKPPEGYEFCEPNEESELEREVRDVMREHIE